jgi:hypothetical protein
MTAKKIYRAVEAALPVFKDTGTTTTLTLNNLAAGAGRLSDVYDRGAGSLPMRYKWRAVIQWANNPVAGEAAEIYVSESDGTLADGAAAATDGAMTSGQRNNLKFIGAVVAEAAAGSVNYIASGVVNIYERYFSVGVWNASAARSLRNGNDASNITFTAMPDEIQ